MNSQNNTEKRFFIHTLGCKVNQYDSQAIRETLLKAGFKECLTKEIADIYIINTCTVTERADKESRYWMGHFHKTNPHARIIVTGCYAEKNARDISFLPGIAHIVGNADKFTIADLLVGSDTAAKQPRGQRILITDFSGHTKAFVKIQDGCENACSYCTVPMVRGSLKSRPIADIVEEIRTLTANGFKEVVLTGICLGAWGKDIFPDDISKSVGLSSASVIDVMKAIDRIPGDFRVRLSSIEVPYVTDELLEFLGSGHRWCKHLHIPLQSGDDDILKRMNRPYTAAKYKALVERANARIKNIAITTDVLIGFPGETDVNFKNTVKLIKDMTLARTHIFTFSKRKDTPAYDMDGQMPRETLKKRFCELNIASLGASYIYRERFLGKQLDVLVETRRDKHSNMLTGYSDNYIRVIFEGPDDLMKKIVPVKIEYVNLIQTRGAYEPQKSLDKDALGDKIVKIQ